MLDNPIIIFCSFFFFSIAEWIIEVAYGRFLNLDYKSYTGYRLVVAPKGMSSEELEEGYEKFIEEFYSAKNVTSRFRNQHRPLRQLTMYAAVNLAYRFPRQMKSRAFWG